MVLYSPASTGTQPLSGSTVKVTTGKGFTPTATSAVSTRWMQLPMPCTTYR